MRRAPAYLQDEGGGRQVGISLALRESSCSLRPMEEQLLPLPRCWSTWTSGVAAEDEGQWEGWGRVPGAPPSPGPSARWQQLPQLASAAHPSELTGHNEPIKRQLRQTGGAAATGHLSVELLEKLSLPPPQGAPAPAGEEGLAGGAGLHGEGAPGRQSWAAAAALPGPARWHHPAECRSLLEFLMGHRSLGRRPEPSDCAPPAATSGAGGGSKAGGRLRRCGSPLSPPTSLPSPWGGRKLTRRQSQPSAGGAWPVLPSLEHALAAELATSASPAAPSACGWPVSEGAEPRDAAPFAAWSVFWGAGDADEPGARQVAKRQRVVHAGPGGTTGCDGYAAAAGEPASNQERSLAALRSLRDAALAASPLSGMGRRAASGDPTRVRSGGGVANTGGTGGGATCHLDLELHL